MRDVLARLPRSASHPLRARNLAREYLQARILQELQEHGVFTDRVFLGGTALRFLFDLPRFSEDLDFSSLPGRRHDGFGDRVEAVRRAFAAEGCEVDAKVSERKVVRTAFLRFKGLPLAGAEGAGPGTDNWKECVPGRLAGIDWRAAMADVRPFLERPAEIDLISEENLRRLILGDG